MMHETPLIDRKPFVPDDCHPGLSLTCRGKSRVGSSFKKRWRPPSSGAITSARSWTARVPRYNAATMTVSTLKKQALALKPAQRLRLVQDIWDSLAEEQASV